MPKLTLDQALRGVLPPLITPLHEDQSLDEEGFLRQLRRCLAAGCTGVFVNGSSSEAPWLTAAQRRRTVELAAAEGTVVLAGTMQPGTSTTLETALDAERAGADAVVVAAPYYFGASEQAILRHVETVAERVSVPVVLYNIPQCTHNLMTSAMVGKLAANPRVVGIKDSSGDRGLFKSYLELGRRHRFRVMQGAEGAMGDSLRLGADGLVPGLGNVAPEVFVSLVGAIRDGTQEDAQRAERTIQDLLAIYSVAPFVAALKAAVSVFGVCSRVTAAPLDPATAEQTERISGVLRAAGIEETPART